MLSSWSTSLNLVFLSVAWTTIAASYSPLQLELFAPFVLRLSLYIIPSLVFLLFDVGLPSLSMEFKAQGKLGIPSNQRGGSKMIRRVVLWSCANVLFTVAIQAGIEFLVTDVFRMRSLLLIKGSKWGLNHLPNPWTMFKHAIIGLLSRNILQYYIHTHLLHSPSGGRLAQLHQSWHHSIRIPFSFAANYDHPLPHLLHRVLPLYLPAILLRMHILTYLILVAIFSLEETFVYSGYNVLPSTIMLRGMARRCDAHMMSQGEGNFGCLGVLDWCHGTTLGKDVVEDLKAEMDKHHVEEKAGKAIDGAGDAANGLAGKLKGRMRQGRGKK
ncbi:uncharacterized protein K460DRAFT_335740 [Cucurbitaria berberidis CBS 394.84]|uniref:Fatty acid hydroxylase domain-containing protein n=1 Tax=Cucurbitaria berberidis CBS 394.84 TaxID=1168544 RepID=A0A9P4GJI4_9PLEO|nr:uncharacterized protein K460DRAFT_335740 [Cucurbitaria berberidis CBS 394.84]KAF1846599.1 hypothetical protein K460DRAFT_335740 [Cucurbitaria berberidis CBS 394.84]